MRCILFFHYIHEYLKHCVIPLRFEYLKGFFFFFFFFIKDKPVSSIKPVTHGETSFDCLSTKLEICEG